MWLEQNWIKSNIKIMLTAEVRYEVSRQVQGRVRDFLELTKKAQNDELCFGRVQVEEVGLSSLRDQVNDVEYFAMEMGEELGEKDMQLGTICKEMVVKRGFYEKA